MRLICDSLERIDIFFKSLFEIAYAEKFKFV
jgi:hypothetical protein